MEAFTAVRSGLHRVAVHIVARARMQAMGRFSLRVTPGGFGTPEFGVEARRVRVFGAYLVVECDAVGAASASTMAIHGSSLSALADFAGVDLETPIDVGHDTPPLGDIDAPITIDAARAAELMDWFQLTAAILDTVSRSLPPLAAATLTRLWPEHFDVAAEAQASPGVRVNLGGSPGDESSPEPYLYVGPWTADRPGDAEFWNVPYGAMRTRSELAADPAGVLTSGAAFLLDGYGRLR